MPSLAGAASPGFGGHRRGQGEGSPRPGKDRCRVQSRHRLPRGAGGCRARDMRWEGGMGQWEESPLLLGDFPSSPCPGPGRGMVPSQRGQCVGGGWLCLGLTGLSSSKLSYLICKVREIIFPLKVIVKAESDSGWARNLEIPNLLMFGSGELTPCPLHTGV